MTTLHRMFIYELVELKISKPWFGFKRKSRLFSIWIIGMTLQCLESFDCVHMNE